ncbi:MAG: cytochrome c3 family protein [Bdellovibrionota bacterium]
MSVSAWADTPVEENCLQCHFQGQTNLLTHTPAAENMCDVCHEKNDKHFSINYSSEVCSSCHEIEHDLPFKHKALDLTKQCVSCHNPHGSEHKSFLKMPVIDLCTSCHGGVKDTSAKSTHDVVYSEGGCVKCHRPHGSQNQKLLKFPKEDLCLSCHNKELDYLGHYPTNNRVIRNMQKVVETSSYSHPPAKEKQCTICHNSHQSDQWWLLKSDLASDSRNVESKNWKLVPDKYKTCFKCHNINMLNEKISATETLFRNDEQVKKPWYLGGGTKLVRKNLHRSHGMSCGMCHDVHGGERQHLIKKQWKSLPKGGTCGAGCHGDLDRWEVGVVYKRID